jgi:hypothetical protein
MMTAVFGTPIAVFIGLTVVIMGGAGYLTGRAFAATWRPVWKVLPPCLALGAADRFLTFALFDGELLSAAGYMVDTVVILAACLIAFRLTRVGKMVSQYPWCYERVGLWRYRERTG